MSIDTTPGSDNYRVAVTVDGTNASTSLTPASLTFSPSQNITTGLARVAQLSNNASVIMMQGLPPSVLDNLSGSSAVTLEVKKGVKSIVSITGSAKAVEALRKCNAEQLLEWGADPVQFSPGGTVPTALKPRDEWISNSEFLQLAGKSRGSSINDDFRVLVATDGIISECHATARITELNLEKSVCAAVVGRRLFSPAKDASGNAVLGAASFRVSLMRPTS